MAAKGAIENALKRADEPREAMAQRLAEREQDRQAILVRRLEEVQVLRQIAANRAAAMAAQKAAVRGAGDDGDEVADAVQKAAMAARELEKRALVERQVMRAARLAEAQVAELQLADIRVGTEVLPSPTDEKIWKGAISSILTDEQKRQLQLSEQERRERNRDSQALLVVADVDAELRFTQQQRLKFLEIVNQQLEEVEAAEVPALNWRIIASQIPDEQVTELLSGAQRKRWDRLRGNTHTR